MIFSVLLFIIIMVFLLQIFSIEFVRRLRIVIRPL